MPEPRCDRTDLLVSQCSHCRGDDGPGRLDALSPPTAWTDARYDGRCPACHLPIEVGDRIGRCDDVWVCEVLRRDGGLSLIGLVPDAEVGCQPGTSGGSS